MDGDLAALIPDPGSGPGPGARSEAVSPPAKPLRAGPGRPSAKRDIEAEVGSLVLASGGRKVVDLAAELGLSEVTIRKALDALERRGLVRRFHGEARPYDGDAIPFRMGLRVEEKRHIAEVASGLVEPGDTIFIEAGSAIAFFAERIKGIRGLTVLTPNLFIARIFRSSAAKVVVIGGSYQEESESLVGPMALEAVARAGFGKAFLGVSGFTPASGFTLNDFARAELTRAVIERKAETWVLTDSSKFDQVHAAAICDDLRSLRGVVSDREIPINARLALENAGLRILV